MKLMENGSSVNGENFDVTDATAREYARRCNTAEKFLNLSVILVLDNYVVSCSISKASVIGSSFLFLFLFPQTISVIFFLLPFERY